MYLCVTCRNTMYIPEYDECITMLHALCYMYKYNVYTRI